MDRQQQDWTLNINSTQLTVLAEPSMPLLWVLRDLLSLTGTKYGCGKGLCGACTVHVDGVPLRSCQIPISSIGADSRITTIEGLSGAEPGSLHVVQQAWIDADVPQCGFCQTGQIMQAAGIYNRDPGSSTDDVKSQMSGNLCRCGTHARIVRAIDSAFRSAKENS